LCLYYKGWVRKLLMLLLSTVHHAQFVVLTGTSIRRKIKHNEIAAVSSIDFNAPKSSVICANLCAALRHGRYQIRKLRNIEVSSNRETYAQNKNSRSWIIKLALMSNEDDGYVTDILQRDVTNLCAFVARLTEHEVR